MPQVVAKATIVTIKARIKREAKIPFVDWQARLNASIAGFPGFVSLEILSPSENSNEWSIIQRFDDPESIIAWRHSPEYMKLMSQLQQFLTGELDALHEIEAGAADFKGGVTEVFVTEVSPDKETAYREWIARIHKVEATFPGFRGAYVQSPMRGSKNWITMLQFDTPENLDKWLKSSERLKVLAEAKSLITSLESHRVISPYAGWFASVSKGGKAPPAWKQGMIVLLVLFPVVMLEMKYLSPWTSRLNSSLGTFISNSISVALTTWPLIPLAIRYLKWWLSPSEENQTRATILGTAVVLGLYALEVALLWKLL